MVLYFISFNLINSSLCFLGSFRIIESIPYKFLIFSLAWFALPLALCSINDISLSFKSNRLITLFIGAHNLSFHIGDEITILSYLEISVLLLKLTIYA